MLEQERELIEQTLSAHRSIIVSDLGDVRIFTMCAPIEYVQGNAAAERQHNWPEEITSAIYCQ
jgi:hypothetical protein